MNELPQTTTAETQTNLIVRSDLLDVEQILAGQLAASSIAMYKRDVQAYVDYAIAQGLHWPISSFLTKGYNRFLSEALWSWMRRAYMKRDRPFPPACSSSLQRAS